MFTGIIENLGQLKNNSNNKLTFRADKKLIKKLIKGSSIAINGVCLTVSEPPATDTFSAIVMPETLKRTMLGDLDKNDTVNLELPMTPDNFLAGHIVQGHVDGLGTLSKITPEGNSKLLTIKISPTLNKYIVEKGSITLNGISLTVIESTKRYFTVGIIPHTWKYTMLSHAKIGDRLNIETDILAKYIEKIIEKRK